MLVTLACKIAFVVLCIDAKINLNLNLAKSLFCHVDGDGGKGGGGLTFLFAHFIPGPYPFLGKPRIFTAPLRKTCHIEIPAFHPPFLISQTAPAYPSPPPPPAPFTPRLPVQFLQRQKPPVEFHHFKTKN